MGSSVHRWLCVILCAALMGCTPPNSYEEPTEPSDQLATLKLQGTESYWGFGMSSVSVRGIDRKPPPPLFGLKSPNTVKITSGPHEIAVVYLRAVVLHREGLGVVMKFDAQPGHFYEAHGAKEQDKVVLWILDATTSQEVARSTVEREN